MNDPFALEKPRSWFDPPRRLTLTTPGKFFLGLTLAVGFAAINTGNNLLFLLLGMMLSLITVSGILSEAVIKGIKASRRVSSGVAGQPTTAMISATNASNHAALSVELSDLEAIAIAGPLKGQVVGITRHPWWKVWKKAQVEGNPIGSAYTIRIDAGDTVDLDTAYAFATRGVYRLWDFSVVTRFPFGLFEKSRHLSGGLDITVFPRMSDDAQWHASIFARFGDVSSNKVGQGDEFFGLRDFRDGEDARRIHWKSAARRGKPVVRETELRLHEAIEIVLLHRVDRPLPSEMLQFELGIERLAGLLERLFRTGNAVRFVCDDVVVDLGEERARERVMATLASVTLDTGVDTLPDATKRAGRVLVGPARAVAQHRDADLILSFGEIHER
ncbi:MAG: DUF58 domain-containing protein [bacterium]